MIKNLFRVLYESGSMSDHRGEMTVNQRSRVEALEADGLSVMVTQRVPDEPKVERCEIRGAMFLNFHRAEQPTLCLSDALDVSDFAGFEFADGQVDVQPWRRNGNLMFCGIPTQPPIVIPSAQEMEHAKYVLFRRG
jgi:hypothetical protein